MKKVNIILGLIALLLLPHTNLAASPSDKKNADNFQALTPIDANGALAWKAFVLKYGSWQAKINEATGTPAVAFGNPIKIIHDADVDSASIAKSIKLFLMENKNIFKADTNQIQLKQIEKVQNKWYVTFGQVYDKYDVMFSEVHFTINQKGEVFAFKVTFYKDAALDQLVAKAKEDPALNNDSSLLILPLKSLQKTGLTGNATSAQYHLVRKVITKDSLARTYANYIDVYSGDTVWQKKLTLDFEAKIKMKVNTFDKYNWQPEKIFSLAGAKISVNGKSHTLDKNGEITLTEPASEVKFNFESELTKLYIAPADLQNNDLIPEAETIVFPITEGDNEILLNDNNSRKYERFVIHHMNVAHDKILEVDPSLTCMDVTLPSVLMEYTGMGANAFYNSDSPGFGFTDYTNERELVSTCPAVLYHEYGHAINDLFYKERKAAFYNDACHEGTADINANMILDDPNGTQNIGISDYYMRTSDNTNTYPADLTGEPHDDGMVLSGAFWDLRKLTSREITYNLSHFARYELPDDIDIGTAFYEWFMAVLIADDDDGNLLNGTPHHKEICTAFNKHNIGTNFIWNDKFRPKPPKDIASNQPQVITVELDKNVIIPGTQDVFAVSPDSIIVVYSTDCFETTANAVLKSADNVIYTGEIPSFAGAKTVRYYFEFIDKITGDTLTFRKNNNTDSYDFVYNTGYYSLWKESFADSAKVKKRYTFGSYDNNIVSFDVKEPQDTWYGNRIMPGYSMGEDRYCLLTDVNITIPSGIIGTYMNTTATSGMYPVPNVKGELYIGMWLFEFIDYIYLGPREDTTIAASEFGLKMFYKTDKMADWDTLYKSQAEENTPKGQKYFNHITSNWKKMLFKLPNSVKSADSIQLGFQAIADNSYDDEITYWEKAEICVLVDEMELLTDDNTVGIDDSEDTGFYVSSSSAFITNETQIIITSDIAQTVQVLLFDINGKIVASLDNIFVNAGTTFVPWPDICLQNISSGTYILSVQADNKSKICKLIKK